MLDSLPRPRHLRGASPWHLLIFGHAGVVLSAFGQKGVRRRETERQIPDSPDVACRGMLWNTGRILREAFFALVQYSFMEAWIIGYNLIYIIILYNQLMGFFHHHRLPMAPKRFDLHPTGRRRLSEWPQCDQDASVPFRALMKLIGVMQDCRTLRL